MFCMICKHDLLECTCDDIQERLSKLGNVLIYRKCSLCGKHYALCKCLTPVWVRSDTDELMFTESKN